MKRILLGALAAGLSATAFAVAPAAMAADPDTIHGGCFFDTNSQATVTNGDYTGVIGDRSVTTTSATPPALIGASVTCYIAVNDIEQTATQFTYGDSAVTGVQAGSNPITFAAGDNDTVKLCQKVVYADGFVSGPTCNGATTVQIPPQEVIDAINGLFIGTIDPAVCPVLAAHAGSYGPVTIDSTGDVTVPDPLALGLNPVYDCPPYVTG